MLQQNMQSSEACRKSDTQAQSVATERQLIHLLASRYWLRLFNWSQFPWPVPLLGFHMEGSQRPAWKWSLPHCDHLYKPFLWSKQLHLEIRGKPDWSTFTDRASTELGHIVTEDHEDAVEYFVNNLSNIAHATIPSSKPCNKTNNTVCWFAVFSVLYRLFVCSFFFFFPFLYYVILCVSVFFRQYKWPSGPSVADFK